MRSENHITRKNGKAMHFPKVDLATCADIVDVMDHNSIFSRH